MTVFNREDFVSEAIESVLNQSIKELELIIVDDASIDRSKEIIKSYIEKDKRIKIVLHEKNMGIARSTNDGIDIAKGKYVALIDSDDVWHREKLEKQLQVLKNDNNFIVWTNGILIDESGKILGNTFVERNKSLNRKKTGYIFFELLHGNFINKSSLIFQKQNLGNTKFNENFKRLDDYQFVVDLAKTYEFFFINESLTSIRLHYNQSLSTLSNSIYLFDYIRLFKYFLRHYFQKIPIKTKLHLYNNIIMMSTKLSMKLKRRQMYEFNIDPFEYILSLKNESKYVRNELIKVQNRRATLILFRLFLKSFRSFIVGLALVFKLKKINKSFRFWLNFIIFIFFKLIPKVNFPQYFLRK